MNYLPPGTIIIPKDRMRKLDNNAVKAMADSMNISGQLSPILINMGVLVAGLHRLEASKLLKWAQVATENVGDAKLPERLRLIEIDENLVRQNLSATEFAHHVACKAEILNKLYENGVPDYSPKTIFDSVAADKVDKEESGGNLDRLSEISPKDESRQNPPNMGQKQRKDEDMQNPPNMGGICAKVESTRNPPNMGGICTTQAERKQRADKTAAEKKVKEVIAAELGHKNTNHVSASIKNHEAVTDAGLDQDELKKLNGAQYKAVASTAKDNPEAAKKQLDAVVVAIENGSNISADKLKEDKSDYVLNKIKRISDTRSIIKLTTKMLTGEDFPSHKNDTYISNRAIGIDADLEELVAMMREKFGIAK